LRDLVGEALDALEQLNRRELCLFQHLGVLVRIKDEDGATRIEALEADSLRLTIDVAADWITDKGNQQIPAEPPEHVVRSILKLPAYDVPTLRGIAHAPFFSAAGKLVRTPGYDRESQMFLDPGELAALDPVPDKPTDAEVKLALEQLAGQLFTDFPFATDADRANAIGLLLTPFVRPMIDGLVPLYVINSPQVATGKSLLASVAHLVATGAEPPTGIECFDRTEAHKTITAMLIEARPVILLDNVDRRLISGQFAAVLTAPRWTDRVLGQSKTITVENRAIWIATGNNLTLSSELRRRALEIRIDAKTERPEERTSFRHADLKEWTRANRSTLVWSCLVLIQNWLALGRPPMQRRPMASFESWSKIVGGILAAAGVEGFLANAETFRLRADPDAQDWRRFIEEWAAAHASNVVNVEELMKIADGFLDELLGSGNAQSQRIRLGKALRQRRGQIITGWQLEPAECRDADGRVRRGWRLQRPAGAIG
jgi:hypothetical protein